MWFSKKQNTDNKKEVEDVVPEGLITAKPVDIIDLISPSALQISPNHIQVAKKYTRTLFIANYPRYLNTGWLSPLITLDQEMNISLFIYPSETNIILKRLTKKTAEVQSQMGIQEEKGMVRDPQLEVALSDIEDLRDRLQEGTERLFEVGIYITLFADDVKTIEEAENKVRALLENQNVYAKTAVFQQEQGFISTLPLGDDKLLIRSKFNTAPLSSTFPFISSDLTDNKGVLYGINRHNNSLILFDRFSLENANMVVFAKSGSGKSYSVKLETLRALMQGADAIIIDPEKEYKYLAETVDGSFIDISLTSPHHLNPFDLPMPGPDENPADILRNNIINLSGLIKIMLGGLTPEEDAIIDGALAETYAVRDITAKSDFSTIEAPLMQDFSIVLKGMTGAESLVTRLERFVTGSFSGFFNQPTNVRLDKKLVVFSIRDVEAQLRPLAMYVILRYIWNIIRGERKKRLMIVDEAWWMMQHEDAASFLFGIAKRCRKYFLGLTTVTQDVSDFMNCKYGKPIVTNSSLQLLLKQSPASIDLVKESFNLTDQEKFTLLQSSVGEGIFFAGTKRASIQIVASYTEDQIITSDPAQLLEIEKAKQELAEEEARQEAESSGTVSAFPTPIPASKEIGPKSDPNEQAPSTPQPIPKPQEKVALKENVY